MYRPLCHDRPIVIPSRIVNAFVDAYSSGTASSLANCTRKRFQTIKRTLDLARLNLVRDILGAAAVDLAASAESSSENLLDGTLQVLGHRLEAHGAGDLNDLIERNALGVLDVLLLLAITRGLLEGLDNERRGGGNDGDGGLTVLDGQPDSDAETLPVASGLGDIFTDLCAPLAAASSCSIGLNVLFGDRPRGPILGARADEAPTSPPVARRWMTFTSLGSNLGATHI